MPIHPIYLLVILVVVLLVFGPSRLPELGSAVGKAMREFRKATTDLTNEVTTATTAPKPADSAAPVESTAKGSSSEAKPSSN